MGQKQIKNDMMQQGKSGKKLDNVRKKHIQQLIKAGYDRNLERLSLKNKQIAQIQDLLQSRNWGNLKFIGLSNCNIQDDFIKYLCMFEWTHLEGIWLGGNNITHKGILQLLSTKYHKIKNLAIQSNLLGDEGMKLLLDDKQCQLQSLTLADNGISTEGFRKTIVSCQLLYLKYLDLSKNKIGSQGIKYLVKANIPQLQTLTLKQNLISEQGCRHLCKGKWVNIIKFYLGVYSSNIDVYGSFYLGDWKKLLIIDIENKPYIRNIIFNDYARQKFNGIGLLQSILISSKNKAHIWSQIQNYKINMTIESIFGQRFPLNLFH